jgi:hypothetical protein
MTEKEREEIERRCAQARKGPWVSFVEDRDHVSGSNFIRVGKGAEPDDDIEMIGATVADQDFIAHARSDVPKLISEIKKLRKKLRSVR